MAAVRNICPALLAMMVATANHAASAVTLQSAEAQTALLELYMSEGCSSCPPAETWLSRLKESPKLWKDYVPVAFHVDYWDYLGWKDPFASKACSERQRDYADHWRSRSVYTPSFVLDGKEWRGWLNHDGLPRASNKRVGTLTARSEDGSRWTLRFEPVVQIPSELLVFHAALLGCDLISDVKAGENGGRKLLHDFTVLALASDVASKSGDSFQGTVSLSHPTKLLLKHLAVAAWVTPAKTLSPLQAVGGWLSSTNGIPPAPPAVGQK